MYHIYIGEVEQLNDSTILLNMRAKNTIYVNPDQTLRIDKIPDDLVSREKINLRLNEIEKIENYRSWFYTPSTIGWLSLVSGIVVSPLISIDYKNGSFNSQRFLKTSAISLGIAAPSLLIAYKFGKHTSYINHGEKKNKKLWKIKLIGY